MIPFDIDDVENKIEKLEQSGRAQVTLKPIRDRQENKVVQEIRDNSIKTLDDIEANIVSGPLFFAGSVDFMVSQDEEGAKYYILETNGGSSRGFSTMLIHEWEIAIDGYREGLKFCQSDKPLVLIGHPPNDLLYYEKYFLALSFLEQFFKAGLIDEKKILSIEEAPILKDKRQAGVVMGEYSLLIDKLYLKDGIIYLDNLPVDYLIGDGAARRHPAISEYVAREIPDTVIANANYHITDDKALTYEAVQRYIDKLSGFGIEPIKCWRAKDRDQLFDFSRRALDELPEIIIKPYGGSGGAGIDVIADKKEIDSKIKRSVDHYSKKFGYERNPYPYTVCQRVKATPIDWREGKHLFDIRIYVARNNDRIVPIGALSRVSLEPYTGVLNRKSFVVNLSGYKGVDTSRGLGISKSTLDILNLSTEDFVNMFTAASILMAEISNNYQSFRHYF